MSKVFKVKYTSRMVGLTPKEVKRILFDAGVITKSLAIKDPKGLVVELWINKITHDGDHTITHTETTLLITEVGVMLLSEIAKARDLEVLGYAKVKELKSLNQVKKEESHG